MDRTCKTCNFSSCRGFRDREGRCPENMAGDHRRWRMPRIDPNASITRKNEQFTEQCAWLKKRGFKSAQDAINDGC